MIVKRSLFFSFRHPSLCLSQSLVGPKDPEATTALRIIALLDYIAGDYHNAVAPEGGKILNNSEYAEMRDFSDLIDHYIKLLETSPPEGLRIKWAALKRAIENQGKSSEVEGQASSLKLGFIQNFSIPTAPTNFPDLNHGKELFQTNCMICHGNDGRAQTPVAKQLNPFPAAFTDPKILNSLSPFKAYNTLTFGIENTAMPSFWPSS